MVDLNKVSRYSIDSRSQKKTIYKN